MDKKLDIKKFASNNAIIILIALLAIGTGVTSKNFFTINNFKNLVLNVSPRFIIACGVSGCLIRSDSPTATQMIRRGQCSALFSYAEKVMENPP